MLEAYPDEQIAVYAVWFNMIPGDRKSRWDQDVLYDKRVRHYWDEERELGRWISETAADCEHLGPVDWDSFYLFQKRIEWKRKRFPNHIACGTPILNASEELDSAISDLFDPTDTADSSPSP